MATTLIIRPTADAVSQFTTGNPPSSRTGAATDWQAQSDISDASYNTFSGGASLPSDDAYELANPVLTAAQRVVRIRPVLRMKKNSANDTNVKAWLEKWLAGVYQWATPDQSINLWYTSPDDYRWNQANVSQLQGGGTKPANGYFEQADLDNLRLSQFHEPGGFGTNYDHRVYDSWAELEVWEEPTSSFNALNYLYAFDKDAVLPWTWIGNGEAQYGYKIRVFTDAQLAVGGFNPLTSPATHEADVVSSATNHQCSGLSYATHYTVYLWTKKAMPTGVVWQDSTPTVEDFYTAGFMSATSIVPAVTTATNKPLIDWAPSVTGGGTETSVSQEAYLVRIFKKPVAGWTGFNPDTNTVDKVIDSGIVLSSTSQYQVDSPPLDNQVEYRQYIQLKRSGVSGGGPSFWGPWANGSFTTDLAAPPTPTLSTAIAANGVDVEVTVTPGFKNLLTADQASGEATASGWVGVSANTSVSQGSTAPTPEGIIPHGTKMIRQSRTSGAGATTQQFATTQGAGAMAITTGLIYAAMGRARTGNSNPSKQMRLGIQWFNAANAIIQTDWSAQQLVTSFGWVDFVKVATAPALAVRAAITWEVANVLDNVEYTLHDRMMFRQASTLAEFEPAQNALDLVASGSALARINGVPAGDLSITDSKLSIVTKVSAVDWTPAANQFIFGSHNGLAVADGGYSLRLDTTGVLSLLWSTGAALVTRTSTVAVPVNDGKDIMIRIDLIPDNGAAGHTVSFYVSWDDGTTWYKLGADVVTAGVTSIGANVNNILVGGDIFNNVASKFVGKMYSLVVYKGGYGGTKVVDVNYATAAIGSSYVADGVANQLIYQNESVVAASPRVAWEKWIQGGTPDETYYMIEHRAAGGAWLPFSIGAGVKSNLYTPVAEPFTVTDREATLAVLMEYRAYGVSTALGTPVASQASNIDSETLTKREVWIKDLYDPTNNRHFYTQDQWLGRTLRKSRNIIRALGRSLPIVVRGTYKANDFTITLLLLGQTDYDQFIELMNIERQLLIQTPKGNWYTEVAGDVTIQDHLWDSTPIEELAWIATIPVQEVEAV